MCPYDRQGAQQINDAHERYQFFGDLPDPLDAPNNNNTNQHCQADSEQGFDETAFDTHGSGQLSNRLVRLESVATAKGCTHTHYRKYDGQHFSQSTSLQL